MPGFPRIAAVAAAATFGLGAGAQMWSNHRKSRTGSGIDDSYLGYATIVAVLILITHA